MRDHRYAVYIMASRSHNLYIGVTNDIGRRVREHKSHAFEGFTAGYNVDRLVWYKIYGDVRDAIAREKQLKRWVREKKNPADRRAESDLAGFVGRMGKANRSPLSDPQILRLRRPKARRLRSGWQA